MPIPEPSADVGEQLASYGVSLAGGLGDERPGQGARVAPSRVRRCGDDGYPASIMALASRTSALPLAYCSQQPRAALAPDAARDDLHVPELAGNAVAPSLDPAVDDERRRCRCPR